MTVADESTRMSEAPQRQPKTAPDPEFDTAAGQEAINEMLADFPTATVSDASDEDAALFADYPKAKMSKEDEALLGPGIDPDQERAIREAGARMTEAPKDTERKARTRSTAKKAAARKAAPAKRARR